VGTFARSARRGENIRLAVHAERGAVHEKHVMIEHFTGYDTVYRVVFEKLRRASERLYAVFSVGMLEFRLHFRQIGVRRRGGEKRLPVRKIITEKVPVFFVPADDPYRNARYLCAKIVQSIFLRTELLNILYHIGLVFTDPEFVNV
jgi:hypothetical protein